MLDKRSLCLRGIPAVQNVLFDNWLEMLVQLSLFPNQEVPCLVVVTAAPIKSFLRKLLSKPLALQMGVALALEFRREGLRGGWGRG